MFNKYKIPITAFIYTNILLAAGGGLGAVFFLFELEGAVLVFAISACAAGGVWLQRAEAAWEEKIHGDIAELSKGQEELSKGQEDLRKGQEMLEQRTERIEHSLITIVSMLTQQPPGQSPNQPGYSPPNNPWYPPSWYSPPNNPGYPPPPTKTGTVTTDNRKGVGEPKGTPTPFI